MDVKNRTIFTGDCLDVMRGMQDECIDLIYLDPPFNSNHDYAAPIGSQAAGAEFKDTWGLSDIDLAWWGEIEEENSALYKLLAAVREVHSKSMMAYLIYMAVRVMEMRRLLKPTGSVYLHCDPTSSHYLKLMMDAIFGKALARNEIVWKKYGGRKNNATRKLSTQHDTILFYAKSSDVLFIPLFVPHSQKEIEKEYKHVDESGRKYRLSRGRQYQLTGEQKRLYLDESPGRAIGNLWVEDGLQLNTSSSERTGYPTQKPLELLKRIIKLSTSHQENWVLDPFCGCATTCVAAEVESRHWVGIDVSETAFQLVKSRLRKTLPAMDWEVTHREDIPSDREGRRSPDIKHTLYGKQEGKCRGCLRWFHFRNMTLDHIVPRSRGGADVDRNLQLLCGACNSKKGRKTMEELIVILTEEGLRQTVTD